MKDELIMSISWVDHRYSIGARKWSASPMSTASAGLQVQWRWHLEADPVPESSGSPGWVLCGSCHDWDDWVGLQWRNLRNLRHVESGYESHRVEHGRPSLGGSRWKQADLGVKARVCFLHPRVSIHIFPSNLNQKPSSRNLIQRLKRILRTKRAICLDSIHTPKFSECIIPTMLFLASGFPISPNLIWYPGTFVSFYGGHSSHAGLTSIPGLRITMNCRVLRAQIPRSPCEVHIELPFIF